MANSYLKIKIDGSTGGGSSAVDGKYVRTTRFVSIGSGTSGTLTLPASSTVVLDDFGGTVDAVTSQISGGFPTFVSAATSGGTTITATLDSSGNYTLSAAPSAYPIALIYRVQQTFANFDSTSTDIIGDLFLQSSGSGATAWGAITGTLSNQTDLNTALSGKESSISSGTTSQYLRGDKSWQTLDKTAVGLSNVPNTDATTLVAALMATQDLQYFGNGIDGNVSVTSPITLTSDMYYNNLTISGSGVITTGGYKIFVAAILDITNAAANAIKVTTGTGNAASNATGGTLATVGAAQTVGIGGIGIAGITATSAAGTSPGASSGTGCMGGPSGAGGKGGNGTNAGGNGRAGTSPATFVTVNSILRELIRGVTLMVGGAGSTGGSAGGGDGTNLGGGGGGGITGGGVLYLAARTINRGSSTAVGAIAAVGNKGGKGGNGAVAGNTGGGGGGPGSGGGWVYLIYRYLAGTTATTAINLSGGDGGDGGTGAGTGLGGQGGSSGIGGRLTLVCVDTSTITDTTGTAAGNTSNSASVPATTTASTGAVATFFGVNL